MQQGAWQFSKLYCNTINNDNYSSKTEAEIDVWPSPAHAGSAHAHADTIAHAQPDGTDKKSELHVELAQHGRSPAAAWVEVSSYR